MSAPWLDLLAPDILPQHLEQARKVDDDGGDAARWLVQNRVLDPQLLIDALSRFYERPGTLLGWYAPEPAALTLVPQEVARRLGVLPLFTLDSALYVALPDPYDLVTQDFLQQLTSHSIETVVGLRDDIEIAHNRIYLSAEQSSRTMGEISARADTTQAAEFEDHVEDKEAPAIRMVEHILTQAIHLGASDVHLEPYARRVELRYRVDGILHEFPPPPAVLFPAVVSRIKIAARLDIAEKRMPQDGRLSLRLDDRSYDMRVAVIPNLHGEGVVIRLLNTSALERDLSALGFDADMLARYERVIRRPHGMVLVTGPTGSGKTTTLYATIRHLFTTERKFVTLEDPVELQMDGVTQIQIRPDIGFNFTDGLRAVLRYDPDVVLVGEIRDTPSAEIAMRAALTGHLLLSTLHTNNAPLAVTRLVDMGLPAFMVLSSLNGVLAQRLLRRLCVACKVAETPTRDELLALGLEQLPAGATPHRPVGCPECGGLGYRGRVAVYEFLEVTRDIRRMPVQQLDAAQLSAIAEQQGMVSLRDSALRKFLEGITSVREVLALTTEE